MKRMVLCCLVLISGGICAQDDPDALFHGVNEGHDLEANVRHDIAMFDIILKVDRFRGLGNYYRGLLMWIEKEKKVEYLPFVVSVMEGFSAHSGVVQEKQPESARKLASFYLTDREKRDIYKQASRTWYALKMLNASQEEMVAMLLDSFEAGTNIPRITDPVWELYAAGMAHKRDELYSIVLKEENRANPRYDQLQSVGGFSFLDVFRAEGLEPDAEFISAALGGQYGPILFWNIAKYLVEESEDRADKVHSKAIVGYVLKGMREPGAGIERERVSNLVYRLILRKKGWLTEDEQGTILALMIKEIKTIIGAVDPDKLDLELVYRLASRLARLKYLREHLTEQELAELVGAGKALKAKLGDKTLTSEAEQAFANVMSRFSRLPKLLKK